MNLLRRNNRTAHRGRRCVAGFTLIELMIVMSIIFILLGIAAMRYDKSVLRAHEAVLHQDLQALRQAIDNYTLDKEAAPQSLEDLESAGYLHFVPTDPITHAKDWRLEFKDVVLSPEQSGTGVTDVHSNSDQVSPFEATPYSSW
ncbi:MAG TPA: prepilin-type N-terminal cleavage/methylation domain-containing protein [Candidatus Acidoferrum sp.]|nr:prepilin-type N-terminal cleavage/methylation domain-containing protein [Candidatus Acidoferrum sp.]